MTTGGGMTTMTQAAPAGKGGDGGNLSIVWRFPRVGEPPVALQWDGAGEIVMGRDAGCAVLLGGTMSRDAMRSCGRVRTKSAPR